MAVHKVIKIFLCSILLPILAIHLLYNAVAVHGLLGRTDKTFAILWPPRWPFIFITINFYSEKH